MDQWGKQQSGWNNHPFPLLLYLEWILIAIALMTVLSPNRAFLLGRPAPPPESPGVVLRQRLRPRPFVPGILLGSLGLILLGTRLPIGAPWKKWAHTLLGFSLSWLSVLSFPWNTSFFAALIMVVVMRACVLFPHHGRIVVALAAYGSFLLLLWLRWTTQRPLSEWGQQVVLSLTLNSAILFGMVLVFVLLLIGALLTQKAIQAELSRSNARLRTYALRIENQATLQERSRIAREIHDSLGHHLTAQSIQLENTALFIATEPDRAQRHLEQARQLGSAALKEIRASVALLRSHPLERSSFPAALEALTQHTPLPIVYQIHLTQPPSTDIALALYRIAQEAITNITKHSAASAIELDLLETTHLYRLEIRDNGMGFDPQVNTTGFGIQSMQERAVALGGKFVLTSQIGQGTRVTIEIPKLP